MDELDGREGVEAQHRSRFRVGRIAGGLEDAAARVVDEDVNRRQARQPGGDGVGVREVERVQGDAGGAVASGGGLREGVLPAGDEVQGGRRLRLESSISALIGARVGGNDGG